MNLLEFFRVISWLVLPPSIFIIILFISVFLIKINKKNLSIVLILFVGISLYLLSIEPIKDKILYPLEYKYPFPDLNKLKCDAVITLGGGLYLKSPEENGKASLKAPVVKRLVTTFKIWKKKKRKIVLTGGRPLNKRKYPSEAEIMANFLEDLGVPKRYLILEKNALNTYQNAKNTKEIIKRYKWKNICLVTTASHMPRAVAVFNYFGIKTTPVPTDYKTSIKYNATSYFPQARNFEDSISGIHEYIGLIFYKIRYGI
jgi:uncharacterized SAM-binding protein YcdF (DUF218 family)